ncbi:uncharacterized protein LOC122117296 [Dipodomys spectabilis]|uniref:uncharacterized protein LOC122117296 n=1 Tax=Dipodomys spectabilis TaxID=105255 RepID=UPI001C5353BC|nr:uncharacterized protein LOC122117296 [Dipodomys spectabilis]
MGKGEQLTAFETSRKTTRRAVGSRLLSPCHRRGRSGRAGLRLARRARARSPGTPRASQQESPAKVGIFPLTNRSATLTVARRLPPPPSDSRLATPVFRRSVRASVTHA